MIEIDRGRNRDRVRDRCRQIHANRPLKHLLHSKMVFTQMDHAKENETLLSGLSSINNVNKESQDICG